ncbi:MAG: ABC transporter ATP-binding protein [Lachnospiraceae bacterium]|nr:ABC transporter ATP-binding protein [Lachnospiraceae bacterium]
MARPVIRVKDLYKIYRIGENKVRALNGVDFNIEKGEFCCIVGTSGSGKSTLLNMLAGLEKPTKGEIVIAGEHIEKKSESQLVVFRQAHVGFIFQSYNLLPNMTALENVALPLTFQGVDKKTRLKRAAAMLKMVGLAKYIKHKPGQMSGGQQQRVGIARALVVNPEIIFADEPTGNLDSNTSLEVMQLIQKIVRKRNQTLVMVTHDNYLAGFGDKVIHIRDGKILKIDDNRGHHQAVDPDGQNIEKEPPDGVEQNAEAVWQPENATQGAADMQMQGTIEEQAAVQALEGIPAEETVS